MRHLEPEDIGSELAWYWNQIFESMKIGIYIEEKFIESHNVELKKQEEKPISFTDILNLSRLESLYKDVNWYALKNDRVTTSMIREMVLCICYGVFEYYAMKTYRFAISMIEENIDDFRKFDKIVERLRKSDINIDLESIPLFEDTQMIRRLRNMIMHNYSIIPKDHGQAQMSQDEYNRFLNYLKDHSEVIGIVFDERIVITKDYFKLALEVMYDYYRSASKNVYDFAMYQPYYDI